MPLNLTGPRVPEVPCLSCGRTAAERLDRLSNEADVEYFRCTDCGHAWTEPKPGTSGEVREITPRQRDYPRPVLHFPG